MEYYKGRTNLAATVFVPVKCGNNCPFCNTNELYKDFEYSDLYLDRILDSIDECNHADAVKEFVVTGGEPLMDLDILKKIVDKMEKPVFVNTSLPLLKIIDECIEYLNTCDKIKGVNISRHINTTHSVKTAGLRYMNKITKYVRVNCLVDETMLNEGLENYIKFYSTPYRMVNLRADYRHINSDNLKSIDKVEQWLLERFKYEYSNNCLVCNSIFFSDEKDTVVCYHRGVEHSCVTYGNRCYVNDIIIDMYGNMFKDWDMQTDSDFSTGFALGLK